MTPYVWTPCTHPGCEVELRVLAVHHDDTCPHLNGATS